MLQNTYKQNIEATLNDMRMLNKYGIGYAKLALTYNIDKKTIQKYLGKSQLKADTTNTHRLTYRADLFNEIYYYMDIMRVKKYSLLAHNYGTMKNFPLLVAIADTSGKIVFSSLIDFGSEKGLIYFKEIVSAKLDKSKVIHVDIYSKELFRELETLGFKVCYVCKKQRMEIYKTQHKTAYTPFYQQIEHNFGNIQRYFRSIYQQLKEEGINLNELDIDSSKRLMSAIISIAWDNNKTELLSFLEWIHNPIVLVNYQIVKDIKIEKYIEVKS